MVTAHRYFADSNAVFFALSIVSTPRIGLFGNTLFHGRIFSVRILAVSAAGRTAIYKL